MVTLKILTLKDENEIQTILSRFPRGDIHYDTRYIRLFEQFTGQRGIYFHYTSAQGEFLIVFFERLLPDIGNGRVEKDLVSPWYYGGPIHTFPDDVSAQTAFPQFVESINAYAKKDGVISQFQRLNPALDNYRLYGDDPQLLYNRKTVSIDLTKSLEVIRNEYEYKVRKNLKRAASHALRVVRGVTPQTTAEFLALYAASMDRKHAGDFYYFNERFYTDLFTYLKNEAELFTVYLGDKAITSSLVLGNGTILHDYLRASDPEYLAMRPSDLVLDAIIEWAKGAGYTQYSLGGGHSTAVDDTLLGFKKSFSPVLKDFYLYKKVINPEAYAKRCEAEDKKPAELLFEKADFFPEYKTG